LKGEAQETWGKRSAARRLRAGEVLEEGDGADRWGRPVGDQKREGEGDVGRQGELGRKSGGLAGKRWADGLERRGVWEGVLGFPFFLILFKLLNSFQT
jgi:hypothetical protein